MTAPVLPQAAQPASDPLADVFAAAPLSVASTIEEAAATQKGEVDDGDWGEWDQYEDPSDVKFPTLALTPRETTSQPEESKQEVPDTAASSVQQFPKVTNLDDLMSLMNVSQPVTSTSTLPAANTTD